MERKNRFYRRSHVSERKFRQVAKYFSSDLSATDVSHLTGLTRKTVNTIFLKIRQRIADAVDERAEVGSTPVRKVDGAAPENQSEREALVSFAKQRMQKFKGVSGHTRDLHLKECEWRFQRRDKDLYAELLALLRERPL